MKLLLIGASGFIGQHVSLTLMHAGHEVVPLTRKDLALPPESIAKTMTGTYGIINLAGAPILKRWTPKNKEIIRLSRIFTTQSLVKAMELCTEKPIFFISASAVGIYATGRIQTETDAVYANDFLGKVCRDWEEAALRAEGLTRTIVFRLGVVLGKDGGMLKKSELPFRLGLGGKIGSGQQPFPWIHMDDLLNAFLLAMNNQQISGIYNLVAPEMTSNLAFTRAFAKVLKRPAFLSLPGWLLKIVFGESSIVLTEGQKVLPERLLKAGFSFAFPDIQSALKDLFFSEE